MVTLSIFHFFILLALIWLVLPGLLIPFCISHIKQVEKDINLITDKSHQEIWSVVQNATSALLPMSSSATNLAKVAAYSLGNKTDITFGIIKAKVAPLLFQALLTIPHVSQISYIGKDGMFFALYTQWTQVNQQIFAIYSNSTSLSKANRTGNNSLWYTQPVDFDTGKLYGESVMFHPQVMVNENWLQQAINTTNGYASLGKSWNDVNNLLVLNTARVHENGVISIGFELKSLMDVFTGIKPSSGGLYLVTKDGKILSNGVPKTRIFLEGNTAISFKILRENGYQVGNDHNIMLQLNYEVAQSYIVDILGTKYILYSSPFNLTGIPSVFVLALPYDGMHNKMHHNIIFVFVLLLVTYLMTTVSIFSFIMFMVRKASTEMCLRASLIKQKEATQQAERKSKNQNLAFVSASHDIRASLAGFDGLIEMSINDVRQVSELAKNFRLMQECSHHLHSMLNSILDTSKIEAGMMELEEKPFDIVKVVEGVVDLFYPVGLNKEVDVILDLHDGSLTKFSQVIGDERRLRQILSNLLSNAIKFTSDGYVSVRVRAMKRRLQSPIFDSKHDQSTTYLSRFFSKTSEKCANLEGIDEVRRDHNCMEFIFEINDTGKGIPKEKQGSVFEQYVQVKETALEDEGTGLGLAIVQSLVRLMGGEISIVDKVREKGTCFRFYVVFKVSRSDLFSNSEDEKTPSLSNLSAGSNTPFCSPIRQDSSSSTVVLFISSDARRRMAQKFLRAQGIKVLAVENIQLLLETLRGFRQEQNSICALRPGLNLSFGYLIRSISRESSPKNVPLSVLDGTDVSPARRTNRATVSGFILLVIDTTRADFHELCKVVAEFRKNSKNACFRVVWLGFRCMKVHGLDEKHLPPSDIIIPMPLHGSRLYSLIDLLPDFGGMIPCTPPQGNQRTPSRQDEIQEISKISPSSSSPLRGKKVLLVEDDKLQQMIAKKSLLKHGLVIDTCTNGEEALTLVSKSLNDQRDLGASHILPYEYIFMDCQMPVMDGCEATRQIRLIEKDYGVCIPIIGLTAHAEGEELNTFLAAGINIHICKPLNEHKILKVVKDLHSR
uniref:histidine kinase CKI1-like n=1 Tax=Erigeron canadensis TaxID=72917 RepID=UPI001CB8B0B7|nr:histidine kinase CKI1-like [Erigeron canadensis]